MEIGPIVFHSTWQGVLWLFVVAATAGLFIWTKVRRRQRAKGYILLREMIKRRYRS